MRLARRRPFRQTEFHFPHTRLTEFVTGELRAGGTPLNDLWVPPAVALPDFFAFVFGSPSAWRPGFARRTPSSARGVTVMARLAPGPSPAHTCACGGPWRAG